MPTCFSIVISLSLASWPVKFFVYFTGPLPLGVFALTAVFRFKGVK